MKQIGKTNELRPLVPTIVVCNTNYLVYGLI